jgi:type II secretory pathway component PulJ
VTAVVAAASLIAGLLAGWWLTLIAATAAISRSQERMQRKVRYWQAETARARENDEPPKQEAAGGDHRPSAR